MLCRVPSIDQSRYFSLTVSPRTCETDLKGGHANYSTTLQPFTHRLQAVCPVDDSLQQLNVLYGMNEKPCLKTSSTSLSAWVVFVFDHPSVGLHRLLLRWRQEVLILGASSRVLFVVF